MNNSKAFSLIEKIEELYQQDMVHQVLEHCILSAAASPTGKIDVHISTETDRDPVAIFSGTAEEYGILSAAKDLVRNA